MVINMLTATYEQAYISSFAKIFTVLKEEYECIIQERKAWRSEINELEE